MTIASVKRKNWYVVYTRSRWEKKTDLLLKEKSIQSFCPIVKTRRKWADRNKVVEFPLFSSYLFVYADPREQVQVRQTAGVVNFVYHEGKPAIISEQEIERIQDIVQRYPDVEAVSLHPFHIGDRVRINDPLLDLQGEIVEIQGKSVVMVLEPLNCALVARVKVSHKALAIL